MTQNNGPHSQLTDVDDRETFHRSQGLAPAGLSFIIDAGSTTSTAIVHVALICGKGAEFFFMEYQSVLSNVRLTTQLMIGSLC